MLCKLSVSFVWEGYFELACTQQLVKQNKTEKTGCPNFKNCIWQNDQPKADHALLSGNADVNTSTKSSVSVVIYLLIHSLVCQLSV